MADSLREIRSAVKEYILHEFLPGEAPDTLSGDTPLITGRVLDSIGITKLVIFLEETYGVEFQTHEIAVDFMDTLEAIARMVRTKIEKDA